MRKPILLLSCAVILACGMGGRASGQAVPATSPATLATPAVPARIGNARVQELQAARDLPRQILELAGGRDGDTWMGYEVPLAPGLDEICCRAGAACSLAKPGEQLFETRSRTDAPSPRASLLVLLRAERGRPVEVRSYTEDCAIDAGGLPILWLRGVRPEDSVSLLAGLVQPAASPALTPAAILAIGAHAGKAADDALLHLASSTAPEVRQQALLRLGGARGRAGFAALSALLSRPAPDTSPALRQQVLFALGMSRQPGAEELVLATAGRDPDAAVRGRALMVYARLAGSRAVPVLTAAIEQDASPEVHGAAVIALLSVPEPERRQVLGDLARGGSDQDVRRRAQAMLDRLDGRGPWQGRRGDASPR
jgi:hypothetical protein